MVKTVRCVFIPVCLFLFLLSLPLSAERSHRKEPVGRYVEKSYSDLAQNDFYVDNEIHSHQLAKEAQNLFFRNLTPFHSYFNPSNAYILIPKLRDWVPAQGLLGINDFTPYLSKEADSNQLEKELSRYYWALEKLPYEAQIPAVKNLYDRMGSSIPPKVSGGKDESSIPSLFIPSRLTQKAQGAPRLNLGKRYKKHNN